MLTPDMELSVNHVEDIEHTLITLSAIDEANIEEAANFRILSALLGGRQKANQFIACVCKYICPGPVFNLHVHVYR